MTRPNTPASSRDDTQQNASTPPTATAADISAALLELLRKVNAEVATTTPPPVPPGGALPSRAQAAVDNYRRIAADLRTPSDPPPIDSYGTSNSPRAA